MLNMAGKIGSVLCCGNCNSRLDEGGGGGGGEGGEGGGGEDGGRARREGVRGSGGKKTQAKAENTENKSTSSLGSRRWAKGIVWLSLVTCHLSLYYFVCIL